MTKDHLDNEISVAAEVTEAGIKAKAKSRFLSGIDRFLGSVFDAGSARIEGNTDKHRAQTASEVKLIETAGQTLADTVANNQDFAIRAFNNFASKAMRRQKKMDTLVDVTLSELKQNPPSEEENSEGQDELSEEFLNRLENYADNASEEELRKKWAKVFAAEVRKPNTISAKTMRIVDELRPKVAALFENICNFRLDKFILVCFVENFTYPEIAALTTAGLILDPNMGGQRVNFGKIVGKNGNRVWFLHFNEFAISIPEDSNIDSLAREGNPPLIEMGRNDDEIAVRVYVLTDEGMAIASILKDNEQRTLNEYASSISLYLEDKAIIVYKKIGENFVPILNIINGLISFVKFQQK